jgi:hypothetical protein
MGESPQGWLAASCCIVLYRVSHAPAPPQDQQDKICVAFPYLLSFINPVIFARLAPFHYRPLVRLYTSGVGFVVDIWF